MIQTYRLLATLLASAAVLAACGPTVTVQNQTQIGVRAIVRSGAKTQVLSPTPGESSSAEVEQGAYRVTVMGDQEWVAYAKDVRQYLNDQLKDSEKLSGPQLLEVIRRLKEVAAKMQEFEKAASSSAACSGTIGNDSGGALAEISIGAGGALAVACR